jgi:hypothetical protein
MQTENCLYGVYLSEKITPIQVRDAIVRCFSLAQEELKKYIREDTNMEPEKIEKMFVERPIENAFREVGGDFNNPTKETLIQVVMKLKEYATHASRDSGIIEKHAAEITQLIDKLD